MGKNIERDKKERIEGREGKEIVRERRREGRKGVSKFKIE
jgi:ribosomal protein L34